MLRGMIRDLKGTGADITDAAEGLTKGDAAAFLEIQQDLEDIVGILPGTIETLVKVAQDTFDLKDVI